jgi:hypothetical protein
MKKQTVHGVPRYFEPHVNDCFGTAYGAVISHMGFNPNIILADYLSFMYEDSTQYIGTNFIYRYSDTVEFTEEELNTSHEFVYLPKTTVFNEQLKVEQANKYKDRININMFVTDDNDVAISRLKELIDAQKPFCAVVDLFYMPYHKAFQKEHGLHAIVVTGYDEEHGTVEFFDKYKLSDSDFDGILELEQMTTSRISDVPLVNPVVGVYKRPIRNLWMEVSIDKDFVISEEKVIEKINQSCRLMLGQRNVLGNECGLKRLEAFRDSLLKRKEEEFTEASVQMLKIYYNVVLKRVSRGRNRFKVFMQDVGGKLYSEEIIAEIIADLDASSKKWEIIANLALKLGISKKVILLDDMARHLDAIIELETKVVDHLQQYSNQMTALS